MDVLELLGQRNDEFATNKFSSELSIIPSLKTLIIGCVDPRVDPVDIFDLKPGEAAVVRNVGGRITPNVFQTMGLLRAVGKAVGTDVGAGWNLIVLHHTDCGITSCLHTAPELLAKYLGVSSAELQGLAITDPYKSVEVDVAALKANPQLPGGFLVSGLVYDVKTGRIHTAVPPSLLRPDTSP